MEKSLDKIAWDDLFGEICANCKGPKRAKDSFCRCCYFELPKKFRGALYTPMSDGYASIYDEAKDWLRIEGQRFKAQAEVGARKLP
jgi:hypothetical protein